jgi:hypothetical protein
VYRRWATSLEFLQPQCESYHRAGVSLDELRSLAGKQSDTEAAIEMQRAKNKLLSTIARRSA